MGVESISTFDGDTSLASAWLETYTQHTDFLPAAQHLNFFKSKLKDAALQWIRALPPIQQSNFATLVEAFKRDFITKPTAERKQREKKLRRQQQRLEAQLNSPWKRPFTVLDSAQTTASLAAPSHSTELVVSPAPITLPVISEPTQTPSVHHRATSASANSVEQRSHDTIVEELERRGKEGRKNEGRETEEEQGCEEESIERVSTHNAGNPTAPLLHRTRAPDDAPPTPTPAATDTISPTQHVPMPTASTTLTGMCTLALNSAMPPATDLASASSPSTSLPQKSTTSNATSPAPIPAPTPSIPSTSSFPHHWTLGMPLPPSAASVSPQHLTPCANAQRTTATADVARTNADDAEQEGRFSEEMLRKEIEELREKNEELRKENEELRKEKGVKRRENEERVPTPSAIPSHDDATIPSHDNATIPSHDDATIPSHDDTTIPSHDDTTIIRSTAPSVCPQNALTIANGTERRSRSSLERDEGKEGEGESDDQGEQNKQEGGRQMVQGPALEPPPRTQNTRTSPPVLEVRKTRSHSFPPSPRRHSDQGAQTDNPGNDDTPNSQPAAQFDWATEVETHLYTPQTRPRDFSCLRSSSSNPWSSLHRRPYNNRRRAPRVTINSCTRSPPITHSQSRTWSNSRLRKARYPMHFDTTPFDSRPRPPKHFTTYKFRSLRFHSSALPMASFSSSFCSRPGSVAF